MQKIVENGQRVWNLSTLSQPLPMKESTATLTHGEDEFAIAGLGAAPASLVGLSMVAESPVNYECRRTQCIQLQRADGEARP
ncbi:flavin reductase family protein, partial [Erwinia amylovora]|nr:flavin reductase family protein [Erwinia amylovora]